MQKIQMQTHKFLVILITINVQNLVRIIGSPSEKNTKTTVKKSTVKKRFGYMDVSGVDWSA